MSGTSFQGPVINGWSGFDGKDYRYSAHSEAVRAAVKAASSASATGYDAEVLVQGVDGKWRTEWPID
ncbi:hypothetical protein LB516_21260 [Mesorhizobium sp. CO1-1-7]|uniref:hypothetical protein n=1 Tax=unclassified Mesorhizobium TaxID=325217 RepID=UPI00112ECE61|nr:MULTISPECIES: hypothetical protein [unclassified Mesorhizobium]MBZ9747771.1 hypothetical protein [Mesorhizobium sp. CO1-1-7]TPL99585.1 hypothetical protein FJ943_14125 [Mesorhizobium sp. B2-3-10]